MTTTPKAMLTMTQMVFTLFLRPKKRASHASISDTIILADWPVIHPQAHEAKQDMIRTHRVVPLPAYDLQGNLIPPERYRNALAGALVRINFTISHWYISPTAIKDPTNSFVANVTAIRILADPTPIKMPMKRKTCKRDPDIGPSSKKLQKI